MQGIGAESLSSMSLFWCFCYFLESNIPREAKVGATLKLHAALLVFFFFFLDNPLHSPSPTTFSHSSEVFY